MKTLAQVPGGKPSDRVLASWKHLANPQYPNTKVEPHGKRTSIEAWSQFQLEVGLYPYVGGGAIHRGPERMLGAHQPHGRSERTVAGKGIERGDWHVRRNPT